MSDELDPGELEEISAWLDNVLSEKESDAGAGFDQVTVDAGEPEEVETYYSHAEEWVHDWLLRTVRRAEGGIFRWCPWWWKHREAVERLDALWKSWEQARVSDDLSTMNAWWRDHFDPQWAALTSQEGPFRLCNSRKHDEVRPLSAEPTPPGYWDNA